jgi:protein SCO1
MLARRWVRPLLWGLLLAALLGVGAAAVCQRLEGGRRDGERRRAATLPELGRVPAFTLLDRDGRVVRDAGLAGAPWIADFVFTRCMSSCPLLSARMARLDRSLLAGAGIRLVSFSVDPVHDTPPVLERYARSYGASRRWLFLTGDAGQIRALTRQGFKLALEPGSGGGPASAGPVGAGAVGAAGTGAGGEAVLHSTRFVLVDARGAIRGYYQALDPEALRRLAADALALARAAPEGGGGGQ